MCTARCSSRLPGGVFAQGGVCPGGYLPGGMSAAGGVVCLEECLPKCMLGMTDRCKNITFTITVIITFSKENRKLCCNLNFDKTKNSNVRQEIMPKAM